MTYELTLAQAELQRIRLATRYKGRILTFGLYDTSFITTLLTQTYLLKVALPVAKAGHDSRPLPVSTIDNLRRDIAIKLLVACFIDQVILISKLY